MTASTIDGRPIYRGQRVFMPQCTDSRGPVMVLGPDKKLGIIRDTTFQPFRPTTERFEIAVPAEAGELNLAIDLLYRLRPGDEIVIHRWRKTLPPMAAPER